MGGLRLNQSFHVMFTLPSKELTTLMIVYIGLPAVART